MAGKKNSESRAPEMRDEKDLATEQEDFAEGEGATGPAQRVELLCCGVGEEVYALRVEEVREIIKFQPVTCIPRCPEYLVGVISLRGEIIPTLDLKGRLGLGRTSLAPEPMIVIVRHREEPVGLLVEKVLGIIKVAPEEVETVPGVISPDKAVFLKGVVRAPEHLVAILNRESFLDVAGDFS